MLTASHLLYALVTISVIVVMFFRKGVVIPTLLGTFIIGWVYAGDAISGFKAVYLSNLSAAKELFTIFLIIALMTALLASLRDIGADRRMIIPIQRMMVNGHVAYIVLVLVTYVLSLFFWPTPAAPLVGALLLPAAVKAGLSPMAAAVAIALAGQGMALSSDYIMQVAPMLSAVAAGASTTVIADRALVLSLITGGVAITLAYMMYCRSLKSRRAALPASTHGREGAVSESQSMRRHVPIEGVDDGAVAVGLPPEEMARHRWRMRWSKLLAVLVPLSLLAIMAVMAMSKLGESGLGSFEGGDGAAFIGGVAALLLIISCVVSNPRKALDRISDYIIEGFLFAFRAMGPVIPIAGFFFLGSSDFSGSILPVKDGQSAPAFLFDLVASIQHMLPSSGYLAAFCMLLIGIITGLDGSGFSGLPLTGSLSGALASTVGLEPETLAAVGQMGAIWAGGGTLVAWSSLVAVAGFAGVSVIELARRNFIPVMTGLIISTIAALLLW